MKTAAVIIVALVMSSRLDAQETKPVPKDSARVSIPGCAKGYVFTAGRRTVDEPGTFEIPEGMHLRMNGPKKLMGEIKAQEGSMIVITGLMRKGQYLDGVDIGGGVRIGPASPAVGAGPPGAIAGHIQIDVEGWRPTSGACPSR